MSVIKPDFSYNGKLKQYAIIFWIKPGETEPSYKTVCFDEEEVAFNLKKSLNPTSPVYGYRYKIKWVSPEPDLVAA